MDGRETGQLIDTSTLSSELLYTSAPQGLRHGSRGFCTVLTTAGMPINVISKLEAISGYRHLFQAGGGSGQNPTTYAHQIVSLGGLRQSVVSRIADYGSDYSGRSNKIAHHVLLEPTEKPAAGPAWLLQQRSVVRSEWLGNCETPGTGPKIPSADQTARICTTWKNVTGDAGWGGVIAEAIASGDPEPLWVVFPLAHHAQLLELMDEAIALLPQAKRWTATFNTFAANIPPDAHCKIRFVPAGSEEARFASGSKSSIDLTKQPSITSASNWVQRARGQVRPHLSHTSASTSAGSFSAVQSAEEVESAASSWAIAEENPGPPPTPEPPELPPELLQPKSRMPLLIAGGLAAALILLSTTWVVARTMAGLPLLPGEVQKPPEQISLPKQEPAPTQTPAPPPLPAEPLEFKIYLDQKQLLAWALEHPVEDTAFPNPIEIRGGLRLPSIIAADIDAAAARDDASSSGDEDVTEPKPAAPESSATLYAWGGDARSFADAESLTVLTTRLSNGQQTVSAQAMPDVPDDLAGSVYWNRERGDLYFVATHDWSEPSEDSLAGAYRSFARSIGRVTGLMLSIREHQAELPATFQNLAEPLVSRTLRGEESMMRVLMRSPEAASSMAEIAATLSDRLQERVEATTKALKKPQQTRLVRLVAECGQLVQAASDLRDAFELLKQGRSIEVPELQFLNQRGRVLRRVPLRFQLSF
ncbi:MAG: hypothetical protein AAFV88_00900 [Planctomycetota bacterium]